MCTCSKCTVHDVLLDKHSVPSLILQSLHHTLVQFDTIDGPFIRSVVLGWMALLGPLASGRCGLKMIMHFFHTHSKSLCHAILMRRLTTEYV